MGSSTAFLPAINCPIACRAHSRPAGRRLGGSASERKKGQEKRQNTPGAALLGFFAATLRGKALQAPAPHPEHACLHKQRQTASELRPLPNAAASGAVKNWGIFKFSAKHSGYPRSLAGLAKPQNIHKSIRKQATNLYRVLHYF